MLSIHASARRLFLANQHRPTTHNLTTSFLQDLSASRPLAAISSSHISTGRDRLQGTWSNMQANTVPAELRKPVTIFACCRGSCKVGRRQQVCDILPRTLNRYVTLINAGMEPMFLHRTSNPVAAAQFVSLQHRLLQTSAPIWQDVTILVPSMVNPCSN
jgi:hypothetical protein